MIASVGWTIFLIIVVYPLSKKAYIQAYMGFFTEWVLHFIIVLNLVMMLNLYYFVKKSTTW